MPDTHEGIDNVLEKQITGKVYDVQGFSLQDGPGIRTTVFLKGCPLRCPWCHSPESQHFHSELSWIALRCMGIVKCGKCLPICPNGAISPGKVIHHAATQEEIRHIRINRALCDNCGDCTRVCFPKALYICGTDYTVDDLLERVCKDSPFYEQSGGGVTISGGEPLYQPQFTLELSKGLKKKGIHTALDTTGYAPYELIASLLPYTDLFLYDLKHADSRQHRIFTGVPNEQILQNARQLAKEGGKLQIRIPIIPDFNDSDEIIRAMGVFCLSLGPAITVVQLLPYHNLGVMKYQRINDTKIALEAIPPSDEKLRSLRELLQSFGLHVTVH